MDISMWTSFLYEWTPEGAVSNLHRHGFTCAELSDEHAQALMERTPEGLHRFITHCQNLGFRIPQAHFKLYANLDEPEPIKRRALIDELKRWCDMFNEIGVKAGVLHPSGVHSDMNCSKDIIAAGLAELLDHSKGMSFSFCLENLPGVFRHFREIHDLIAMVPDSDSRLNYCLDTGHLQWAGDSCAEYVYAAGSKLKALHITDCAGKGERIDHIFPFGPGKVNWKDFIKALREVGYNGLFNYEVPAERAGCTPDILLIKLDYALQLAKTMLSF